MKPPKFTGIRKGYDAVWVGERVDNDLIRNRIRKLDDNGMWTWDSAGCSNRFLILKPCWLDYSDNLESQIISMENFDKEAKRETIFLGYIKVGK